MFVQSSFRLRTWEPKTRSCRFVGHSQANHVVRYSVRAISSVSPVNYHEVKLFLFPTWRSEGVLFFGCFLNVLFGVPHCSGSSITASSRSLVCWIATLCALQRGRSESIPGPSCVEVARDNSDVFLCCFTGSRCFSTSSRRACRRIPSGGSTHWSVLCCVDRT